MPFVDCYFANCHLPNFINEGCINLSHKNHSEAPRASQNDIGQLMIKVGKKWIDKVLIISQLVSLPRLDGMHAIWISVVLWILFQCAKGAATLYKASEAHVTMAIVGGNSVVTGKYWEHRLTLQKLGLHCRSTSLCEVSLAVGLWLTSASPWCVNATL